MVNPEGESDRHPLRPAFDRRLKMAFHGSRITAGAGFLAYRVFADSLGLTAIAGDFQADIRARAPGAESASSAHDTTAPIA